MSDAPIVAVKPDRIEYRASALGSCRRALYAARIGYQQSSPPPTLQKAFDEGHEYEPIILARLEKEHGWTLSEPQRHIEFEVLPGVFVVGHIDSIGLGPTGILMPVDAKAFSDRLYKGFAEQSLAGFPRYGWQQSAYAIGLGVNCFCLPILNKDTNELHVYVFLELPFSLFDIQERIDSIEQLAADQVPIAEVNCPSEWGCPFFYLHDEKEIPDLTDEANSLAELYLEAKRKEETFAIARRALGDKILSLVPYSDDIRTFAGERCKVTIQSNARRMDTDKVKQLLIDAGLNPDDYYKPGVGEHVQVKGASK